MTNSWQNYDFTNGYFVKIVCMYAILEGRSPIYICYELFCKLYIDYVKYRKWLYDCGLRTQIPFNTISSLTFKASRVSRKIFFAGPLVNLSYRVDNKIKEIL